MPLQGTFPLICFLGMQAGVWLKMDQFFETVEYLPILLGSENHLKCLSLSL